MANEAWGKCGCYDNTMHGVDWAQIHTTSFPIDRNVSHEWTNLVFYELQQDFKKEIEFQKYSFKLLNFILIEESNFIAVLSL